MKNKSDDVVKIFMFIFVILILSLYINKQSEAKELTKALKKINKDFNNERAKIVELEKRHNASLLMNIVPVSFSNYMIEFCTSREIQFASRCPIDEVDISYINKFQNLFINKKYDKIVEIIDKYGLSYQTPFKEVIETFTKIL